MNSGLFIFLVMLLSAVLLYVIAYLIGVKKRVGLISSLDPEPGHRQGWVWLTGWG